MPDWMTDLSVWLRVGEILLGAMVILLPLLAVVAYYTYAERKVVGFMQMRLGPSRVGPRGLFQPIADVLQTAAEARRGGAITAHADADGARGRAKRRGLLGAGG